jgi:hypothetical protein
MAESPQPADTPAGRQQRDTGRDEIVIKPALVVRSGGQLQGRVLEIRPGTQILGRHADCELRIDDGFVSRRHAIVVWDGNEVRIVEDAPSANGTSVNGVRLIPGRPWLLRSGDIVRVANIELEYLDGLESPARLLPGEDQAEANSARHQSDRSVDPERYRFGSDERVQTGREQQYSAGPDQYVAGRDQYYHDSVRVEDDHDPSDFRRRWFPKLPRLRRRRAVRSKPVELPRTPVRSERPKTGERVAFTAAYPGVASPQRWYSLSVYIHLDRLQAEVDELITRRSPQFGLSPASSRAAPFGSLLRGTAVRVIPEVQGVLFNPSSQDVVWLEELQEVSFRLQAGAEVAGRPLLGAVAVYAGPLLVAQIPLSIRVRGAGEREEHIEALATTTAQWFRRAFASYAHEDGRVVRAFAEAYRALGVDMLVDKSSLHAGEPWEKELLRLIEDADLFQLFWSEAASRSVPVAKEWQQALKLQDRRGERFIRPVYWQSPWPPPPSPLAHLHFASLDLAELSSITGR